MGHHLDHHALQPDLFARPLAASDPRHPFAYEIGTLECTGVPATRAERSPDLTMSEWNARRTTEDELLTRKEFIERFRVTHTTIDTLVDHGAVTRVRDGGRRYVSLPIGISREGILANWLARHPLNCDEHMHAYATLLAALRQKHHAPGAAAEAYAFLRSEGAAVDAFELAGAIGQFEECRKFILNRRIESGAFMPIRHSTGGAFTIPLVTSDDVLKRLGLEMVAVGTAADPKLMDGLPCLTAYQSRALLAIKNETLFRVVALYLMIKLNDDIHPVTIDKCIMVAHRLDIVLAGTDIRRALEVEIRLKSYLEEKSILPEDSDNMRVTSVYHLYTFHEGIGDWADLLATPQEREYFAGFQIGLPRRSSKIIKVLKALDRSAFRTGYGRRRNRSDRLVAGFDLMRHEVDVRFHMVRRMHEARNQACATLAAMTASQRARALPFEFHYRERVPALGDEPAVDQLVLLRINSYANVLDDLFLQEETSRDVRTRMRGGSHYEAASEVDYLLEYVDTVAVTPGAPVRPLWLVDLLRTSFHVYPASLQPKDMRKRREALKSLGFGASAAQRCIGYLGFGSRSLNNDMYRASAFLDRLYIPIDNLLLATMFGRIPIRISTSNGARPSEIDQMLASDDGWGEIYDMENRIDVTYFEAVPKGRQEPAVFFVDEDTRFAIDELIGHLCWRYHDGAPLPTIAPSRWLSSKRVHGEPLPPAPYIFQQGGVALEHLEFTICQRLLMHGFGDFEFYDVRHAFATVARAENMPKNVLMKILHHEREAQTDHYSDPTAQAKAKHFSLFALARSSLAGLRNAADAVLETDEEVEAIERTGALAKTPGGQCLNPAPCADNTACIGCSNNKSEPRYRDEVLAVRKHAVERLESAEKGNFVRFAEQERRTLADVDAMLREMDLVEISREDAVTKPDIVTGHPTGMRMDHG